MKKKTIALIVCLTLIIGCAIGGTIAWLTDTTGPVTNTFTAGDVDIDLTETFNTDSNNDGTNDRWTAKMIPGASYAKNPVVSVTANSEDCWLFVKFEEKNGAATYLNYTSTLTTDNGWTQGDGTNIPTNVWYRKVLASDTTRSWHLLADDTVQINGENVTKTNMATADDAELVYTAYACQLASFETNPAGAWAEVSK